MKLEIMGSAAYERVPAMFCQCPSCQLAREQGGRNIRTQAQALIDDILMVDFGQDNYIHYMKSKKDYTKLKAIIITHTHSDHYIADDFAMTYGDFGHNNMEKIKVMGNETVKERLMALGDGPKVEFIDAIHYKTIEVAGYKITTLPAEHGAPDSVCYIISDGKTTLLYNNDTGLYKPEVYDFIRDNHFKFDCVICDCTYGLLEKSNPRHHMSLKDNIVHRDRLFKIGAIDENTKWIINHFSHNGLVADGEAVSAEELEDIAHRNGMLCGYDNMEIEI